MHEDICQITYREEEETTKYLKTNGDVDVDSYFERLLTDFVIIHQENMRRKLGIDKYIQDMVLEYLFGKSNPENWDNEEKIKLLINSAIT